LDLTARRDGSSRFGPANEFHDFWSAGTGWIFSKEDLFQQQLSALSFGKLRASYGTTGNDQIGDYQYLSLYGPYGQLPYQGIVSVVPQGLTNPYLQWEETRKLEFGLDLGFLKDRILLNSTYSRNRSSNQLLPYNLPIITGFQSIARNFPATVQNSDWEFILNTVNVKTRSFTWSSRINLTIPNNKLIAFPDLASSSYASTFQVGKSINAFKVYHLLGVNDTTGEYEFSTGKGTPTYNPTFGTDNTVWINLMPKYYGGLSNNFQYKSFELDFLLQYVRQMGQNYALGNYPGNFYYGNQPTYVLNRWQKPGDHALVQRFNTDFTYYNQYSDATSSDRAFSSASFMRLKNLAFSWQLPAAWSTKAHFQAVRIYLQTQNLFTITNYKGMDPENPGGGAAGLPPLRVITAGIQASF
jgi:hypothetical protein